MIGPKPKYDLVAGDTNGEQNFPHRKPVGFVGIILLVKITPKMKKENLVRVASRALGCALGEQVRSSRAAPSDKSALA